MLQGPEFKSLYCLTSKQKVIVKRHYLRNYLKAKRVGVKLKGAVLARS
jgi:hypothetical protein